MLFKVWNMGGGRGEGLVVVYRRLCKKNKNNIYFFNLTPSVECCSHFLVLLNN